MAIKKQTIIKKNKKKNSKNKLIINNLFLKIKKNRLLDDLSFEISNKTALVGPNGSGKTITLSILSQLIKPNSGEMKYNHKKNINLLNNESFKDKIGVMIQEGHFDPDKTVMQEMKLMQKLKNDNSDLNKLLAEYDIQDMLIKHLAHGKYKILLVLQAMLGNPELVILDEPFSGLDILNRRIIEKILKNYKGKLIITTHLLNEIKNVCTDVVFIKDGKAIKQAKVKKIRNLDEYYIKLYK